MNKKTANEKNGKSRVLDLNELIDLFKHFDTIHAGKENLFIPISFVIIPAVLVQWKDITPEILIVAGIFSTLIYFYHILLTNRFRTIQKNIFTRISKYTPEITEITYYPALLRITKLRYIFFFVLLLTWYILYNIKVNGSIQIDFINWIISTLKGH
jgi:hypothetical protein